MEAEQSIIEQRLNPFTGIAEWVVIKAGSTEDNEDGGGGGGGGGPLAHTQYLDMLNDGPRNRAYEEAIRKVVKAGDHVLDIGAGTGLLSMMAWRAMNSAAGAAGVVSTPEFHQRSGETDPNDARQGTGRMMTVTTGRVSACESYLPMFKLARKVLRSNKIVNGVRLFHKRSDELQLGMDMPSAADVLVSEILDSELLGEGLIPTLRHAHAHLLKPNARSVPHKATVYGQLVECSYLWRCNDLESLEEEIGDGLLLSPVVLQGRECGSSGTIHIDGLADQLTLISNPFEVFTFEFSKTPANDRVCDLEIPVTKAGSVHALVSWWVLQLDEDGEIVYSTAPGWIQTSNWRDHWKQCVWYFQGRGVKVCPGDVVSVNAVQDELSVKYVMKPPIEVGPPQPALGEGGPVVKTGDGGHRSHLLPRPERIGLLGDKAYRGVIKEAIIKALLAKSSPVCLIVDDSVLCALTVALAQPNAHIVALLPGLQQGGSIMKALAETNGLNSDRFQVIGKKAAHLKVEDLGSRKVDVLVAEPYFKAYEDLLPWRNLRFWHERNSLAPFLVDHPTLIPCEGILRGVAVFMPDLWSSRRALTSVEGFDHSDINQVLGACGDLSSLGPVLPYNLWQCGQYKELTDPFSMLTFNFSLPLQAVKGSVEVPVCSSGLCHGIALWMDWVMDSETKTVLSTGPRGGQPNCWKQGILLLSSPIQLFQNSSSEEISNSMTSGKRYSGLTISATFNPVTGDIEFDLSTTPAQGL
ncbi:unnamed protein product [Calypogeia fissa]